MDIVFKSNKMAYFCEMCRLDPFFSLQFTFFDSSALKKQCPIFSNGVGGWGLAYWRKGLWVDKRENSPLSSTYIQMRATDFSIIAGERHFDRAESGPK